MIITTDQLASVRAQNKDKKIVLTSGTFDLLHVGHIRYLRAVKSYGDIVVVLLSGDERAKARKGSTRPIYPDTERAEILDALKVVDYVVMYPGLAKTESESFNKMIIDSLQLDMYVTDGPDPRFINLIDKTHFVVLPRVEGGHHSSTSAIIEYVKQL